MLVRFSESTDDRIATHKLESHGSLATANLDRDQQLIYHNELLFFVLQQRRAKRNLLEFHRFLAIRWRSSEAGRSWWCLAWAITLNLP